jgi:lipopolysaccharide transport system permease protein
MPHKVYTPESALRHPLALVADMRRDLMAGRALAWRLFVRDVQAQYRQSLMGYLWAFIPPVLMTLLFVFLQRSRGLSVGDIGAPYIVYVSVGMLFWQALIDAISHPLRFLESSKQLLVKLQFPREALLMAAMGVVLLNHVIRLVVLVALFAVTGFMPNIAGLLVAQLAVLPLILTGLMLSVGLSPLTLLFKDIGQGLMLGLNILLFVTPIGYAPSSPAPAYVTYNPLYHLVEYGRGLVLNGVTAPDAAYLTIIAVAALLLAIGWVVFRLALPLIFERIGGA